MVFWDGGGLVPTLPVWSGRFASVRGGLGGQRLFSDWLMVGGEGGVVVVIFGVFGTGREREAGQPPCLSRFYVSFLAPRRRIVVCGVCMPIHFMAGGGRGLVSFGLNPYLQSLSSFIQHGCNSIHVFGVRWQDRPSGTG